MYWEPGTQFRIRQQNLSGLTGQKDRPQQTGRTLPVSQNGWQSGGLTVNVVLNDVGPWTVRRGLFTVDCRGRAGHGVSDDAQRLPS